MTRASGFIEDFGMDTITLAGSLENKLKAMREAGVAIRSSRDATSLKAVGVTPAFVQKLAAAGYMGADGKPAAPGEGALDFCQKFEEAGAKTQAFVEELKEWIRFSAGDAVRAGDRHCAAA